MADRVYIGIDPGEHGGIAWLHGTTVLTRPLENLTDTEVWKYLEWILGTVGPNKTYAVVEEIGIRPTYWQDRETGKGKSSILRSSCVIYGHYRMLRGMLVASSIPFIEVLPKEWQKLLDMEPKQKREKDNQWKGRLKEMASALFPHEWVTLAVSDALLLADYCRTYYEDK